MGVLGLNLCALGQLVSTVVIATDELLSVFSWLVVSFLCLIVLRIVGNRVILHREDLDKEMVEDRNWGVALFEGCLNIMVVAMASTFLAYDPNTVINCNS